MLLDPLHGLPLRDHDGAPVVSVGSARGRTFASDAGDVADRTGRNSAGVRSGGVTWEDGPTGPRLRFDGPDGDGLSLGTGPETAPIPAFTLLIRATVPDFSGGFKYLISRGGGAFAVGPFDWYLIPGSGRPRLVAGNNSSIQFYDAPRSPSPGVPFHLAVTMEGTSIAHYLDGRPNGPPGYRAQALARMTIRPTCVGQFSFRGSIELAEIYDYALSPDQILREFNDPGWRYRAPGRAAPFAPPRAEPNSAAGSIALGRPGVGGLATATNPAAGQIDLGPVAAGGVSGATNPAAGAIALAKAALAGSSGGLVSASGSIALGRPAVAGVAGATNLATGDVVLGRVAVAGPDAPPADLAIDLAAAIERRLRSLVVGPGYATAVGVGPLPPGTAPPYLDLRPDDDEEDDAQRDTSGGFAASGQIAIAAFANDRADARRLGDRAQAALRLAPDLAFASGKLMLLRRTSRTLTQDPEADRDGRDVWMEYRLYEYRYSYQD